MQFSRTKSRKHGKTRSFRMESVFVVENQARGDVAAIGMPHRGFRVCPVAAADSLALGREAHIWEQNRPREAPGVHSVHIYSAAAGAADGTATFSIFSIARLGGAGNFKRNLRLQFASARTRTPSLTRRITRAALRAGIHGLWRRPASWHRLRPESGRATRQRTPKRRCC